MEGNPIAPRRPGSARNKRYRARRATGIAVLTIPAREYELVEALLSAGRLPDVSAALDRRRVAHAAAEVLDDFVRRWAQKRDA
jgi:hypothetical protein